MRVEHLPSGRVEILLESPWEIQHLQQDSRGTLICLDRETARELREALFKDEYHCPTDPEDDGA